MRIELCLIAIVALIGFSGATLYSIGDNYSVELALIPPIGTYVEELIVNDSAGYSLTGMFTNFHGGNGGTLIMIQEESPEMFSSRMAFSEVDMTNDTQIRDWINYDLYAQIDGWLETLYYNRQIEDINSSYAFTENPYFGLIIVVPVELEIGEKSNTFGSLGAANQQNNEQTLKGYIGCINWYDRVMLISTEPESVFRTILGNLNVVRQEDKGQVVLEDIMGYLENT